MAALRRFGMCIGPDYMIHKGGICVLESMAACFYCLQTEDYILSQLTSIAYPYSSNINAIRSLVYGGRDT